MVMLLNWDLEPGARVRRSVLHDKYGGNRQRGIASCTRYPLVLVFFSAASGAQHGYRDRLGSDSLFHYTGEGQRGDQRMVAGNRAILESFDLGHSLRLFHGARGHVRYVGEFEIDKTEPYYRTRAPSTGGGPERSVIVFRLRPLDGAALELLPRADSMPYPTSEPIAHKRAADMLAGPTPDANQEESYMSDQTVTVAQRLRDYAGDLDVTLQEDEVALTALFLDPNNPRFADLDVPRSVPMSRVHEDLVQDRAMARISNDRFEIEQLQQSIENIGFLPMDRLVVVPLAEDGRYMVVEGNRRLAAMKSLRKNHDGGEVELKDAVMQSIETVPVLIIDAADTGARDRAARVFQGVRHLASVKSWGPYQQAQLIAQMLGEGKEMIDIKEVLGLSAQRINALRRVYYALDQMQKDPEYSEYVKPSLFSQFDEALKLKPVRNWLDWSDETNSILNDERRLALYSWLVGTDENGDRTEPKIIDAKDFRQLPGLLEDPSAMSRFIHDPSLTLRDAARGASSHDKKVDWRGNLTSSMQTLQQVPAVDIASATDEDIELLNKVKELCQQLLQYAEAERETDGAS